MAGCDGAPKREASGARRDVGRAVGVGTFLGEASTRPPISAGRDFTGPRGAAVGVGTERGAMG